MPQHEEDIRYRNSPYSGIEDRNPRTVQDTRYRSTRYPGFTGGTKDQEGNIFFGGADALRNFRADEDERKRKQKADADKQAIVDEEARQGETDFGPADDEHRGIAGTVPNTYEQNDYINETQAAPFALNEAFKQQGGKDTFFDPSGKGSTFFNPRMPSSPELQIEGQRQWAAVGKQWEDFKRNPVDYSKANPALSTVKIGEKLFGRVVCTELMRQGLLSKGLWRDDLMYTQRMLSPTLVRGYHLWAVPCVRLMRKHKAFSKIVFYPCLWRAEELSYQLGHRKKGNIKGKIFRKFIEPLSYMLGLFCDTQDYTVLYKGNC